MYKEYYNLTENPFQLTANPDFFFDSVGHKRAKAYLRYGLKQGEGFVVVIGATGTGKTMLVKELFQTLEHDEESIVIGLMVTSQLDAEDTLRMLATTFKINYKDDDNKAILLSRLEDFFIESAREGKRVLLVVDEAQNLPLQSIEELRMLSNYELEGKVIFQTFLLGQEELGHLLSSSQMDQVKQRIVATYYLKAIAEDEIKNYIQFRLAKAGWDNNPEFTEDSFEEIYSYTKGIPRRINTLCDRLLLYGYLEELSIVDLECVKYVIKEIEEDFKSLKFDKDFDGDPGNTLAVKSPQVSIDSKPKDYSDLTHIQRIAVLEEKVAELNNIINKERSLLRKAILIQLDMDDIYSDE